MAGISLAPAWITSCDVTRDISKLGSLDSRKVGFFKEIVLLAKEKATH